MDKLIRRTITVLSILIILVFTAGLFVGNFFYTLALDPYGDKSTVTESEANQISFDLVALSAGDDWLANSGYTSTTIESWDGLELTAYAIDGGERPWAILHHGYGGHARQLGYYAEHFYAMGFNVLLPDARGHGRSEGAYFGMGVHDRLDTLDWVNYVNETYDMPDILLFGVSMGGATVMMASGEDLPENVKAIVEDCGYTSVYEEFAYQLNVLFGLPAFPVIDFADLVCRARAGFSFRDAGAEAQLARSVTPTLFIHGSEDTFVPAEMLERVYAACSAVDKELLLVEGAGHGGAATDAPEAYWGAVESFVGKYF